MSFLVWCERRCRQLGTHTSYLSPFWYLGSFTIGAVAGAAGDKWSLGFVAETEYQVIAHLDNHLGRLPAADRKTRAILVRMKEDEAQHATAAVAGGAAELPRPVKGVMSLVSRVMTGIAYTISL